MAITPGTRIGPYEIASSIGRGAMGVVYRARDTKLNRDVAIKVLPDSLTNDPDRLARFRREALALASLNHPHIAQIYGFEEIDRCPGIVMEFVDGRTLADTLKAAPLSIDDALLYAKQIAEAIEEAHEKGIIHRDLKPANVKLTADGRVKVLDFGLAKVHNDLSDALQASDSPTAQAGTETGMLLGTTPYMSPEQLRGKRFDTRCDIWAFGCVLYELLTRQQAFVGSTINDVSAAIIRDDPDWAKLPAETPLGIRKLLRRCLEKDPRRRVRHIGDARLEIDEVLNGPEADIQVPIRSKRVAVLLAGVIVAAIIVGAIVVRNFRLDRVDEAAVVRFTVGEPEGAKYPTLGPVNPFPAMSPDGRHIVFTAQKPGEQLTLWLYSVEKGSAQPLPSTEQAALPFWSADGQHIGFFAQGKLKRTSLSGETSVPLADLPGRLEGGTWNRDGIILASSQGSIVKVPETGGPATPILKGDPSRNELYRAPYFLPDGRHFLYVASPNTSVYVGSLDSSPSKRLFATESKAEFSNGLIFFMRDAALMAQRFDISSMALSREAFLVAEGVGLNTSFLRAAFSVSANGDLVYRKTYNTSALKLSLFDRQGKQIQSFDPPGDYQSLDLSPDARYAIAERHDGVSNGGFTLADLWLLDLTRKTFLNFTSNPERHNAGPVWSPDGSNIVFAKQQAGHRDIQIKPSGGGGVERELVRTEPIIATPESWSKDGRFLMYRSSNDLWVLQMQQRPEPYLQTRSAKVNAQFSPDGRWVAYGSNEEGLREIFVQSFPPSDVKVRISTGGGDQPRWRGDGKELYFVRQDRTLMVVEVKSTSSSFDVSAPKELFPTAIGYTFRDFFAYDVSSDGQKFFMAAVPASTETQPLTVILNFTRSITH